MKTHDAITILDHFACALLPIALQMNNGNMRGAVKDSYEGALEVLRQRAGFHARAVGESQTWSGEVDPEAFNDRVVRLRRSSGEES
jgi:hypothetical protein